MSVFCFGRYDATAAHYLVLYSGDTVDDVRRDCSITSSRCQGQRLPTQHKLSCSQPGNRVVKLAIVVSPSRQLHTPSNVLAAANRISRSVNPPPPPRSFCLSPPSALVFNDIVCFFAPLFWTSLLERALARSIATKNNGKTHGRNTGYGIRNTEYNRERR